MLKDLLPIIQKLTEGQDLTASEAEKAFSILESEDEESYFFYTFLAALHTKGETSDELLGFCKANQHFVPGFSVGLNADRIIDLSGTGGDMIKTPNISTAASFIVASKGIVVVKQAFFGVTGLMGSADLMQEFGVDPLAISREGPQRIGSIIKQVGMVIYHANSMAKPEERKGYFNFWLKRVPETGLAFVTAYHLAANVYSPIPMKRRVYGVFSEKYLKPLSELFKKLEYSKGLVVHGVGGLDEVSNIGPTVIHEFTTDTIREYTVTPVGLGVREAQPYEIRVASRDESIQDFLKIIYSKDKGPKRDLVLVNAAAAFYTMDEVSTLKDGVDLALNLIDEQKVADKFEEYVKLYGDLKKLESLKSKAQV
jgi:anthranilate phosphoribosyltransferase